MAEVTAFRNNALGEPLYNRPWVVGPFPILDETGGFVTGAAGLDSEISKNGDTFADCTNEATEIGSSGMYYLLLTATEMAADSVAIVVKTSTTGANPTPMVYAPRKLGLITSGTAQAGSAFSITLASSASSVDNAYAGSVIDATLDGLTELRICNSYDGATREAFVSPGWNTTPDSNDLYELYDPSGVVVPSVDVAAVSGDMVAAATVELFAEALDQSTGQIDSGTFAAGAITASALAADAVDEIWDEVMEGTTTARQSMRLNNAAQGAKLSGAATTTVAIRDLADSKDRVTATVDASGNRTAVTLDLT